MRDVASAGIQRWQTAANSSYAVVKALMHNIRNTIPRGKESESLTSTAIRLGGGMGMHIHTQRTWSPTHGDRTCLISRVVASLQHVLRE